jgi:hypothetical protein
MNPNKSIQANFRGILISYDDQKRHFLNYEPKRDVVKKQQINGSSRYQTKVFEFNRTQLKLYNEAVYGFKAYSNEVIMEMRPHHIKRIQSVHGKAKEVINEYKLEIANANIDAFLSKLFPKSKIVKTLVNIKGVDTSVKIPLSLKDLKITSESLAKRLVQCGVLPQNFFNLV